MAINYEKYWLSRIISVQAIVSADYMQGHLNGGNEHIHQDAWELVLCLKDNVSIHTGNDDVTLTQRQLILIQPGLSHCLISCDENANTFVLSFTCNNDSYLFSLRNRIIEAKESSLGLVRAMIQELESTFVPQKNSLRLYRFIPSSTSPVGAEQMICCYLEQFLILLLRDATMEQGNVMTSGRFHKAFQTYLSDQVTSYIQQNLNATLSVQSIANHFHYSRARLSALYKEVTGLCIIDAICNARIQAAKSMLHEGGQSITQISEALGFSSPQYFSYKFAKATGMPPTQYCKKYKQNTGK